MDTGSNGTLRLTSAAVKDLGLENELEGTKTVNATGYGGRTQYLKGQLRTLSVGNFSVEAPTITFSLKKLEEQDVPAGNIGNEFLQNFVVTFDYRRKRVIFDKN